MAVAVTVIVAGVILSHWLQNGVARCSCAFMIAKSSPLQVASAALDSASQVSIIETRFMA